MPDTTATTSDLTPILDAIAARGVGHLNTEQCCRLIDKIMKSIMHRAKTQKLYTTDDHGHFASWDFSSFKAEDEALATLVSTLTYSNRFHDFFNMNARKLGRAMAEQHPLKIFTKTWTRADEAARMTLLKELGASQLALFRHDGLTPQQPALVIADLKTVSGNFNKGAWGLSTRFQDKTIKIARLHLEQNSALSVCQTVWHEHVHSLCQQFAAACQSGVLTGLNPFHADAKLQRTRLDYQTIIPSALRQAYASDPEENLAYATEKVFAETWDHDSRWHVKALQALGLKH